MNFYNHSHPFSCGIDLHARSMYVCVLEQQGNTRLHRNIPTQASKLLELLQPFRDGLAVAVEGLFSWSWLADLCAREHIAFVLGHALYLKAIHGGKAKNDNIDSLTIASLLRAGMLPQVYVYPPEMRATRDLLRRRNHLTRRRAELLAPIQNTNSQYNLPAFGKKIDRKSNRRSLTDRLPDPSVQCSIDLHCSLLDAYDQQLKRVERSLTRSAKSHDVNTFSRLRSVPGIGKILALTILYEIPDINRFDKVGNFLSYARLMKGAKESAGKRYGSSGAKIGNAHLRWAFGEAGGLFHAQNTAGVRWEQILTLTLAGPLKLDA